MAMQHISHWAWGMGHEFVICWLFGKTTNNQQFPMPYSLFPIPTLPQKGVLLQTGLLLI